MLVISRKANETITIEPESGLDPGETLQHAFLPGAIEIRLISISGGKVRLAIDAPKQFKIWRGSNPTTEATRAKTPARADTEGGGSDPDRSGHRGSS